MAEKQQKGVQAEHEELDVFFCKDNVFLLTLQSPDQTLPPHQALQDPPALHTQPHEPSSC